jgi:hypothetical protein
LFKVIAVEEEEEEVGFVIALLEREKSADIFSFSQTKLTTFDFSNSHDISIY